MATKWLVRLLLMSVLGPGFVGSIDSLYGWESDDPISAYSIDVRLEEDTKFLIGTERVSWTNRSQGPVTELWFHLYWNAFKSNRTP